MNVNRLIIYNELMETNLEKAKRLTRDNAAIKGINLPDTNFFYEMLELAATPDAVDKNDLLPDVIDIIKCDDCGGELYYDETNKYYICKECKTTQ